MSLFDKYRDNDDQDLFVNFIENQFTVKEFHYLKATEYEDKFVVEFKPTDRCNFSCSYCCFHDNSAPELTRQNFLKYLEVLKDMDIRQDKIFLFVYGGEPTLHPYLVEFIDRFDKTFEQDVEVLIQSNGCNWSLDLFKHHCEIMKELGINFRFSFSYHAEKAKISDLQPKIKYLTEIDAFDVMTYMITRKDIGKHLQNITLCKALNIPLYVRTILQESEWFLTSKYRQYITTPDDNPYIVTDDDGVHSYSFEDLAMRGYLNFNGYCCSAGRDSVLLSSSGKVYRCDMDFLYDRNEIYDVNISLEPIYNINQCLQCDHKFCSIYYGDKWNEKTANLHHEESESS